MTESEKIYLEMQGFLKPDGTINNCNLQKMALFEAHVFLGELMSMDANIDTAETVLSYLEVLEHEKEYMAVHDYVQKVYARYHRHEELDGFYTVTVSEDLLSIYVGCFVSYMKKILIEITENVKAIDCDCTNNQGEGE